ncbi:ATP-binding protein [Aquimarina sp. ERC-38]|uniref:ATP-binding protein n=1 Tax=Aquimarina sp. ERC-38 TaxID=2949996 RepID=UPI0022473F5C|nr:ATP-binding protein [Aquimarina sp. ERC-38]UZO80024.1 ATP-binding protein [Aquimarina sp. ERC-38]
MNIPKSLDFQTFNRLRKIYVFALGAIALFTLFGQVVIQQFITSQLDDSEIINISGRQRMLSQKLTKEILLYQNYFKDTTNYHYLNRIEQTLQEWTTAHKKLVSYNKREKKRQITTMFNELQPVFSKIEASIISFIKLNKGSNLEIAGSKELLDTVIFHEPIFLGKMDAIVQQYETEAKTKVVWLQRIEYVLAALVLLILIVEFIFLFRPVALGVKQTISNLLNSERKATKMANNAEKLRKIQNENVQELITLTKAIDQTLLYARVDEQGTIITLGKRFAKILSKEGEKGNILNFFQLDEVQQNRLLHYLQQNTGGVYNEKFHIVTSKLELWLDISILSIYKKKGTTERLLLCSDITTQVVAQEELEVLRAKEYKVKEELQRLTVSQIVEAQEEERKRIAKEIHDSIGQMLTALKFNIEAINLKNPDKATVRIEGLKKLAKDLIKGIRVATFNLTPPELTDYGIVAALDKMVLELRKLTGKEIVITNNTTKEFRFGTLVETNLYRITQEAVNNAIKYAEAEVIMVTINHSDELLSITIQDDGKGFDLESVPKVPKNNAEGGMGLFFMKERINYIEGRIFIKSKPGKGTKITLNYPIQKEES